MDCTSTSRKILVYSPAVSGFFSLPGKEICVANESMRHALNRSPTCSKVVSPWSQVNYSKYAPEERAKVGRYGIENGPPIAARHFSQLLDGKLLW